MTSHYKKSGGVVERRIGVERLLVPLGTGQAKLECMYSLNEQAAAIWDLAIEGKTTDEIIAGMAERYEVQGEHLAADVARILAELVACGALAKTE